MEIPRDRMFLKFRLYGFLKNLRFFDPFIVLFFLDAGMTFFSIGLLYSVREVSINILEIPTGFLADTLGRRRAMLFSFSSYIVSFVMFFFFHQFWAFALAMVFFASGEAFRSGTHKAMILDHLKMKGIEDMKVEYYGRTRSASQFGSALSSLVSIALVFYFGAYRFVFLAAVVPYVFELFLMASYPRYLDGDVSREKAGTGMLSSFGETWRSFTDIFRSRDSLQGILNSSVYGGAFKALKEYLQPILKAQALALPLFLYLAHEERVAALVGLVYFVIYIMTSWMSRSAGRFASRFSRLTTPLNLTFALGGAFMVIAGLSVYLEWYWIAVLAFVCLYLLLNLRKPLNVGYISDTISSKVMASGLSVESQLVTIVVAVLAPLIGYMADKLGIGPALAAAGTLYLLTLPFVMVREPRRP